MAMDQRFGHSIGIRGRSLIAAVLPLLFLPAPADRGASSGPPADCDGCSRTSVIDKFVNAHAPQYEKRLEEWMGCMQRQLGSYASFDPDDPKIKQAMAECAHLDPGLVDYMSPASVVGKLTKVLKSPCFSLIIGRGARIPEYLFRGSFDAGVTGRTTASGQEVKSRLVLELYYNGDPVELVRSWTTESPLTSVSSHYTRMFDNSDAELRRDAPVENLLRDFERRPVHCTVDLGNVKMLTPGEEVDVKITGFRDEQGRPAKPFNRIVVKAERGHIKGGTRLVASPGHQAFRVGSGTVTFTYRAPDSCDPPDDRIVVHSSCSILDPGKEPLEMTSVDKRIAEKPVPIVCPDLLAEYTSTFERELEEPERNGRGHDTFIARIRAAYRLRRSSKGDGEVEESYDLISAALESVSGNGSYSAHYVLPDGVEHTVSSSFSVSGGTIDTEGVAVRIAYDAETGSVRKAAPDIFGVAFSITGERKETIKYPDGRVRTYTDDLSLLGPQLLPVVSSLPEFEKAAGSRAGGTISGGGTHVFPASRSRRHTLSLQYTFRKVRP